MAIEISNVDQLNFLLFVEQFSGKSVPSPLRRAFSLMRLQNCKTVVYESREWEHDCSSSECGQRFKSCKDYVAKLPFFKPEFVKKTCWRIGFFNSKFSTEQELISRTDDEFMGYCIVHRDEFTQDGRPWPHSYVTESLFQDPFKSNGMTFGAYEASLKICGKKFQITKKYFSQQNGLTNCCAHAAIKMAIRSYYPKITSERINKTLRIDHMNRQGGKGLSTPEIQKAIRNIAGLDSHVLSADEFAKPSDFLKAVYLSLESRLPVILLFNMPGEKREEEYSSHAIAMIGHTFNEHSWWPYGYKWYFMPSHQSLKYIPSIQWCDNFIIQDDNFGQYYLMPVRFLTDSTELWGILTSVERSAKSLIPDGLKEPWLDMSVSAIFIYPKNKTLLYSTFVEPWALHTLNRYIQTLGKRRLPSTQIFEKYFLSYQRSGDLILRTFMISRDEYMLSDGVKVIPEDIKKMLAKKLPGNFWITEISIPELFWINREKVGEIITNPKKVTEQYSNAAIFIRLPNIVSFHNKENFTPYRIRQGKHDIHHKLIHANGLLKENAKSPLEPRRVAP